MKIHKKNGEEEERYVISSVSILSVYLTVIESKCKATTMARLFLVLRQFVVMKLDIVFQKSSSEYSLDRQTQVVWIPSFHTKIAI